VASALFCATSLVCPIKCLIGQWTAGRGVATNDAMSDDEPASHLQNPDSGEPLRTSRSLAVIAPADLALRGSTALLLPGIVEEETELADAFARAARASNTHRAYESDWKIFAAWCAARAEMPLPTTAEIVRRYIAWEAAEGRSPATIERRVAAIGYYHRAENFVAPTAQPGSGKLRETMAGIRNSWTKPTGRKSAADAVVLQSMLDAVPGDGLRATRDRAVLAIGMAAALRRSELVALTVDDIAIVSEGLRITIAKSKTDQAREGVTIAVPEGTRLRPKARLLAWMAASGHAEGALFRRLTRRDTLTDDAMSDRAVARLVQTAARKAGLDERQFAGHSLRAGFLTESAARGATIFKMQEVSRHKTVQILSEYVRNAELFKDHAGSGFL
jgi:site-specific recombinase XerD